MNNLLTNYEKILEVLQKISTDTLLVYQRRRPKLFDLELISLVLTAEFMGIDNENHLFRNLPNTDTVPNVLFTQLPYKQLINQRRTRN